MLKNKKHLITFILIDIIIIILVLYVALWIMSIKKYPVDYGISFNIDHAESLGFDWQETYLAMLDELQPKYIRISANWSDTEEVRDKFDSTDVDWMMLEAGKRKVGVVLTIGQKAPRWPECHVPSWTSGLDQEEYREELKNYIKYIVERYRNHPALDIWQVENEPYINFRFGECAYFDEGVVKDEIELVKSLDSKHKVLVTDSGELSSWRKAIKAGDIFGTTVYRIVMTPKGYYWNYDWLPVGFYKLKYKFWFPGDKPFIVSELQAEPWFTGEGAVYTQVEVQEKSMNPERLQKHFNFVERMGVSRAYLWGVEWWYWMKIEKQDERYWEIVKEKMGG
ncbi:beta-galactosidase [Patescibacteria group bacterium]|nr:beta-galactosidase [Patescibacteria group bacterium]